MRTTPILAATVLAVTLAACGNDPAPAAEDDTPVADTAAGSRDNPHAAGETVDLGDWTITLGPTDTDAADQLKNAHDDITEDSHVIMVDVTATYTGADAGTVWADVGIDYVGGDGNTYNSANAYCGLIEGTSLSEHRDQYPDATVTGAVCVAVPAEAADGTWRLTNRGGDRATAFVGLD